MVPNGGVVVEGNRALKRQPVQDASFMGDHQDFVDVFGIWCENELQGTAPGLNF